MSTQGSTDPTILEVVESYCNNYESRFIEVMALFNDESNILGEVSIDYNKKVAIYDEYGDDMYAINNNDNHETCRHNSNIQFGYVNQVSHDSYFVEFALDTSPTYL